MPPNIGIEITKDLVEKGYDNFWYQPGAESEEISNYLTKGYSLRACTMAYIIK